MALPAAAGAKAWIAAHRTVLAGGAIGGAALLGLRARSKGKAGKPPAGGSTQMAPVGSGTQQSYTGAGTYDSTANDIYNAIEPQIEALSRQVERSGMVPGPVGPRGPGGAAGAPGRPAGVPPRPRPVPRPKPRPKPGRRPPVVVRRRPPARRPPVRRLGPPVRRRRPVPPERED